MDQAGVDVETGILFKPPLLQHPPPAAPPPPTSFYNGKNALTEVIREMGAQISSKIKSESEASGHALDELREKVEKKTAENADLMAKVKELRDEAEKKKAAEQERLLEKNKALKCQVEEQRLTMERATAKIKADLEKEHEVKLAETIQATNNMHEVKTDATTSRLELKLFKEYHQELREVSKEPRTTQHPRDQSQQRSTVPGLMTPPSTSWPFQQQCHYAHFQPAAQTPPQQQFVVAPYQQPFGPPQQLQQQHAATGAYYPQEPLESPQQLQQLQQQHAATGAYYPQQPLESPQQLQQQHAAYYLQEPLPAARP